MTIFDQYQIEADVLNDIKYYLEHSEYSTYTNRVINPIARYLITYNIHDESRILFVIDSVIKGNIYIRCVGDKVKFILKEFMKYYESTK